MDVMDYLTLTCATWYLSFCLTALPGPRGIFILMRSWRVFGILQCIYCTSFWVGVVLYLFIEQDAAPIVHVFGIAGAANLLASFTGVHYSVPEIPDYGA